MKPPQSSARVLDQFYTRPEVADRCTAFAMDWVRKQGWPRVAWMEPSAGTGAFFERLPEPRCGMDVDPRCAGVLTGDYLTWDPSGWMHRNHHHMVIGNPPFGRNASMALKFFNRSADWADAIAFIVPRTFEKESLQRRLHRGWHLSASLDIPPDSFVHDDRPRRVPVVFQIWERRDHPRPIPDAAPPPVSDFSFVRTARDADFCIQRVGAAAGKATVWTTETRKAPASHYFLRATGPLPSAIVARLNGIDWTPWRSRTAGNPSLTRAEVARAYLQSLSPPTTGPNST